MEGYGTFLLVLAAMMGFLIFFLSIKVDGGQRSGILLFTLIFLGSLVLGAFSLRDQVPTEAFMGGAWILFAAACGLLVGFLIGTYIFPIKSKPVSPRTNAPIERQILLVVALFGILAGILQFILAGSMPLLEYFYGLIRNEPVGLGQLRVESYVIGSDRAQAEYFGQGYFRVFHRTLLPWAALALAIDDWFRKRKISRISWVLIFAACFFGVSEGRKWPLLYLAVAFILGYGYSRLGGDFRKLILDKTFLAGIVLISAGLIFLALAQQGGGSVFDAFVSIVFRIAGVDVGNMFLITHYVDSQNIRFYGRTWLIDIAAFQPGPRETFSIWVHQVLYGSSNTAPPTLPGSFYVNFGIFGVFIGMIAYVIGISALDSYFTSHPSRSTLLLATQAFIMLRIVMALHTDIVPQLFGVFVISVAHLSISVGKSFLATARNVDRPPTLT